MSKIYSCQKCGGDSFNLVPTVFEDMDLSEIEDDEEKDEISGMEWIKINCISCKTALIAMPWDSKKVPLLIEKSLLEEELKKTNPSKAR